MSVQVQVRHPNRGVRGYSRSREAGTFVLDDPRGPCVNCGGPLGEDNVDRVCGPCAEVLR